MTFLSCLPGLLILSIGCSHKFGGDDPVGASDAGDAGGTSDAGDGGGGVNQPPVAVDDAAEALTDRTVEIDVTDNDSDPEGGALTVSEIVQPADGLVAILPGEMRVEYTSVAGFVGIDSFEYTVSDEAGATDQATVTVNVEEVPILTLIITDPEEDDVVDGPDVEITFEITGCNVSRPAADSGGCHVHRYLDGAGYEEDGENALGWYSSAPFTITPLAPGPHEFRLELITNIGTDDPVDPAVSDTVNFVVSDPGGDSDTDTDTDSDTDTDTDTGTDTDTDTDTGT